MNPSSNRLLPDHVADSVLGRLADELAVRIQAGEAVDIEAVIEKRPAYADQLRRLMPVIQALAGLSSGGAPDSDAADNPGRLPVEPVAGVLGDFRIIREVGKGGMGIVFEAEQISLRRRVALKVLPFAATMDPRHLQRFHNEAQAAACLHHTNIVPVFSVGCERGVHFYAMQFIDGQPLSDIIHQLCRMEKNPPGAEGDQTAAYQPPPDEAALTPHLAAAITPLTGEGRRSRDYYRQVAELGVQAAEALDHAHQLGIVHRDIKPANLLLDGRGNLWVTDFGLAHMQHSEASLTGTGQMVGTPRYMSPEQALAKRVPIDHRTDVYSLGATLYELLTLQPAFGGEDRQELLRQIAFEEPPAPRRVNKAIPAELEIIALKMIEKNPTERYATAQEAADDLRHWLEDRPIRARRPSWIQVARKWARRNQAVVWSASTLLLVLLVLGFGNAMWWVTTQTAAETDARAALHEAKDWQKVEKWSEALSALRRAQGALRGFGSSASLRQQVDELYKDLEMAQWLEEAQLQRTAVKDGHFDAEACIRAYAEAFAWYRLDVEQEDASVAAESIRSRSIQRQLVAALDYWASLLPRSGKSEARSHVLSVARAADTNAWRNRLRDACEHHDGKAVNDLLASAQVDNVLPDTMRLLIYSSYEQEKPSSERVASLLRQVQQRHPSDFWVNHELAWLLHHEKPIQLEEAIRYYMIAVALRPTSPGAHLNLGHALAEMPGRLDQAIAEYRVAIQLKEDYAEAHNNLGNALRDKGLLDEAIEELSEAVRLKKNDTVLRNNLGTALRRKRRIDEAITQLSEAIRLKNDFAEAHYNLGNAWRDKHRWDEAIGEYSKAIQFKKDYAKAYNSLGACLLIKGRLDEAIKELRKCIYLQEDHANAHYNLGYALSKKNQLDEAIKEYREAIRVKKDDPDAYFELGSLLIRKGEFPKAVVELRQGHTLGSRKPGWQFLSESAAKLREAESLASLDDRLHALLKGQERPKDARECLSLAQLCQIHKKLFAASARWYGEAFAQDPKMANDLNNQHRYNAACAAALAGCGKGTDADKLDAKEHARLRKQALEWLRADLKAYRQKIEKATAMAGPMIVQRMQHWLEDADFAGMRDPEALAKMPEAECKDWQKLWEEVKALRQVAAQ